MAHFKTTGQQQTWNTRVISVHCVSSTMLVHNTERRGKPQVPERMAEILAFINDFRKTWQHERSKC